VVFAPLFVFAASSVGLAQEATDKGWAFDGEISGVWAGGNSVSRTLGLDGTVSYSWPKSVLSIQAGGLRTESTLKTRVAIGTEDEFRIEESSTTATTSEAYQARTWYDYRFSKKSFFVTGVDWLRNTFSGVDSRFLLGVGSGNTWIERKGTTFETSYGVTYTFESDIVEDPFNKSKFPGLRIGYRLATGLTATTRLSSRFAGDWNLDNTKDIRFEWTNSISVTIISVLALRPSLKLLWRNAPALTEVPLQAGDGTARDSTVIVPLRKLDTFLTLALAVTL
jgi:hypothetical protein